MSVLRGKTKREEKEETEKKARGAIEVSEHKTRYIRVYSQRKHPT